MADSMAAPGGRGAAEADAGAGLGSVRIGARFNGPVDSAQGGYASGLLARHLEAPAQVTLRLPPPLERELAVVADGEGGARLLDGERLVAEARALELELLEPPVRPSFAAAEGARRNHPGNDITHPLSGCFVCGPHREDSLRVCFGPIAENPEVSVAPFVPDTSIATNGVVAGEFVWAALDCPSYVPALWPSLRGERPLSLLGRFAAERLREVEVCERLVVVGWPLRAEGRKRITASAMLDSDGAVVARAQATWIEMRG